MVKYLKEEFVITRGTQPSRSQIEKVSRKIIRDTSSKYDSKVLADNLSKSYEYLHSENANQERRSEKGSAYLYGSYGAFRKQNMGRLNLSDEGGSLDTVYEELANMYPEFFDYETNEGDQPFAVIDALDVIKPQIRSTNQEDMDTVLI